MTKENTLKDNAIAALAMDQVERQASAKQQALDALESDGAWSMAQWRAVAVAGSGFLTDSYDNFIIGLIVPMLGYVYFDNKTWMGKGVNSVPSLENGWLKAASSYGNLVGQLTFGILGDLIGRKKIYGIALIILIAGALGGALAAQPMRGLSIVSVLAFWRFILGFGVGGDYPVSSVITSEYATSRNRGTLIALVFAMQGVGILLAAGVAVASVTIMKGAIEEDVHNMDYVWRFLSAFGCVPALAAVYYRMTISESPRYTMNVEGRVGQAVADATNHVSNKQHVEVVESGRVNPFTTYGGKFVRHFSQWKNLKVLIACAMCWFLLDIGYYGTNLNTNLVLNSIGYTDKSSPYRDIYTVCMGQLIIALCGNVPGYYFTVFFIDRWGRKPIQIMGFVMLTLCFSALGFGWSWFKLPENSTYFVVVYSMAQFFFNFGPNSTTFIYPAEVFPTAVRSSAHGISAATGKLGAILAAQLFPIVVDLGGEVKSNHFMGPTLIILASLCFLGLLFTFLLPETMGRSLEELGGETEEEVEL